MQIWSCVSGGRIVGVLAADNDHIHLLFVGREYHRKGIARQLFDIMVEYYCALEITVNSSPYAVEAYRKLGLVDTDTEQTVNGLRFTPMKCILYSFASKEVHF